MKRKNKNDKYNKFTDVFWEKFNLVWTTFIEVQTDFAKTNDISIYKTITIK